MRTLSAQNQAALDSGSYGRRIRVKVEDSVGTFRDLTTYGGVDWLNEASWGEDVDAFPSADVVFKREVDDLSLASLMQNSAMNRAFNPANPYAALLDVGRKLVIEAAILPLEVEPDPDPAATDWFEVFRGYIDTVDAGAAEGIRVGCRDLAALLADTFIETERVYAFDGGTAPKGFRQWQPNTAYESAEYLIPSDAKLSGFYYMSTATGTSDGTEPTWPTTPFALVADGGTEWECQAATSTAGVAVETIMQQILDDNLGAGVVTLYTPTSPGWIITPYLQQRVPVLDALRALAQQIGWDVRYKWDSGTSSFRLTFYEPPRSKTTPDRTLSKQDYLSVERLALDRTGVRNVVRVIYSDPADRDANGDPKRKVVELLSSSSIARFGRRFMEIAEDDTFGIDTDAEATVLANAVLSDLSIPHAELEVTTLVLPIIELGDLLRFSANGRHFSADQDLAVVAYRHSFNSGNHEARTSITCRGFPSGGFDKWLGMEARPGVKGNHKFNVFSGGITHAFSAETTIEGARLTVTSEQPKLAHFDGYEFHVSTVSGFTPTSSTLIATGRQKSVDLNGLTPGQTYYAKAVPRHVNAGRVVRAPPTGEVTFTAGRGNTGHLVSTAAWGKLPLNGGFETVTDGQLDHWSGDTAQLTVRSDSSGYSGENYVRFAPSLSGSKTVRSARLIAKGSSPYRVQTTVKGSAGTVAFTVAVEEYDAAGTLLATTTAFSFNSSNHPTWTERVGFVTTQSGTRFAQVKITAAAGSPSINYVDFDEVRVEEARPAGVLVFTADTMPAASGTTYMVPGYFGSGGTIASEIRVPCPTTCQLSDLHLRLRTASTNVSYAVTVRVDASDTALTATLGSGATGTSDTTNRVSVTAGSTISVKVVTTAGGGPVAGDDLVVTVRLSH